MSQVFRASDGETFDSEKALVEYETMRSENENSRTYIYNKENGKSLLCDTAEAAAKLLKGGKYVDSPAKCKGKAEAVAKDTGDGKEPNWPKLKPKDVKNMERTVLEEKMYYLELTPEDSMTPADMLSAIQAKMEADAENPGDE